MQLVAVAVMVFMLAGCADAPTELVVVVDSDLRVPDQVDEVGVAVVAPSGAVRYEFAEFEQADAEFPLVLFLERGGAGEDVEITAMALRHGRERVRQTVRTRFLESETRMVRLLLFFACEGLVCGEGETCRLGECESADIDSASLPDWPGKPPAFAERDALSTLQRFP